MLPAGLDFHFYDNACSTVSTIYIFKVRVQYKLFHLPFVSFLRFIHIDI